MTLEQLVKKEELSKEEILKYFEADTAKDAFRYIETKIISKQVEIDDAVLYRGLNDIMEMSMSSEHNPISERLTLINMFLAGYYGIDMRETGLLINLLGVFNYLEKIEEVLKDNSSFYYYESLYEKYFERKSNIGLAVTDFLEKLSKDLEGILEGMDEEKIDGLVEEAKKQIESVKEKM